MHRSFIFLKRWNVAALVLMILAVCWSLFEAFDNVLYTSWWRQNIHWFTPIVPAAFCIVGIFRREGVVIPALNVLLLAGHYWFLHMIRKIGEAGADVFRLL